MPVQCYAAQKPKEKLEAFQYEPKELGLRDVEVKISHCGICHSDIHLIDGDWGNPFPVVPGHEIIGTVTKLGGNVNHLRLKQRVGIGWQAGSCGTCEWCRKGQENNCAQQKAVCMGNHGGFSESIRVDSSFVFPIPEKMQSETAAPLLCGGITVYSPLRRLALPWMKVGVIGIGGLGHLAIQFAAKMGCEVTAFSTSKDKEKDTKAFGARRFVLSTDAKQMEQAAGTLDLIISTVNKNINWGAFLNTLRPHGTLCQVGAVPDALLIPSTPLILGHKSVCGSVIGSPTMIQEMLEFAVRHGIAAKTEVMPMKKCNEAIGKVRQNKARYRMVLKN